MNEVAKNSEIISKLQVLHEKLFKLRAILTPVLNEQPRECASSSNEANYGSAVMLNIREITRTVDVLLEDVEL